MSSLIAQRGYAGRVEPVDPASAVRSLAHEPGVFQHLQVLGHRRSADREFVGEFADRARPVSQALDDCAPGGIPQSAQRIASLVSAHER